MNELIAIIVIVIIAISVVGEMIRYLKTKRNRWFKIMYAEGEYHRIPLPPHSVKRNKNSKPNAFFSSCNQDEFENYVERSLPEAGWEFENASPAPVGYFCYCVFSQNDKRLNLLWGSFISKRKVHKYKLLYTIDVNVKRSPLEEELHIIKDLGKVGNQNAVLPLLSLLEDKREVIRRAAVSALIILKDERSVQPLINKTKDDDKKVRLLAVKALGELGYNQALETLISGLNNNDQEFQNRCAESLGKIKDKRAIEPLILAVEYPPNWELAMHAALALGKIGDKSAIEPLRDIVKDDIYELGVIGASLWSLKRLLTQWEYHELCKSLPFKAKQLFIKKSAAENSWADVIADTSAELITDAICTILDMDY